MKFFPLLWRAELSALVRLAVPVVISRLGVLVMVMVDTMMLGRAGADELAFAGVGQPPVTTLIIAGLGFLMGTLFMTSRAFGAGALKQCGAAWRRSVKYALVLGIIGGVICQAGPWFLKITGQAPDLAAGGGTVIRILGLGLPFVYLHVTTSSFLEGIRRPLPGMLMVLAGNVLNIFLNWLLIFGNMGLPELGAVGSAISTVGVRVFLAGALILWVLVMRDSKRFGVRRPLPPDPSGGQEQRRMGYATGGGMALEAGAFAALSLLAGLLGKAPLAAFTITLNVLSLLFMFAIGLATASSVLVGNARGRGDREGMLRAGLTGAGVTVVFLGAAGALIALSAPQVARAYTDEADLLVRVVPLLMFLWMVAVPDGLMAVISYIVRGAGDVWTPLYVKTPMAVAVMLPAAYGLAFLADRGVRGILEGLLLTVLLDDVFLGVRFFSLCRQDVRKS